jgi:uncharacterized repeat protein (TIGR01451 family)/CSLREA domain-containing protein
MKRIRVLILAATILGAFGLIPHLVLDSWTLRAGFSGSGVTGPSQKSPATVFTVNSTADTTDGICDAANCTLREAIIAANANPGPDSIVFNIGSGTPSIAIVGSPLPSISDPISIDGNTGGATRVEINGSGLDGELTGLSITAGSSTIKSLVINRFGAQGIAISAGGGNVLEGNLIGTNAAGTAAQGNGESGVLISGSANNTIGGTTEAQRNVISGNLLHGVLIFGSTAMGNVLQGNYIGLNAAGTASVSNVGEGVSIVSSTNNTIGGTTAGARNIISGNFGKGIRFLDASDNLTIGNYIGTNAAGTAAVANQSDGVDIFIANDNTVGGNTAASRNIISGNATHGLRLNSSSGNTIQGNFIGTRPDGITSLPNVFEGISIGNASNGTIIGGSGPGEGNKIAFNGSVGVNIADGTGNSILSNELFSNGGLGINLGPGGVTANDIGDGDSGANNLQNFPIITSATTLATGGLRIQGTLNSTASTNFTLQFFVNATCDPTGNGEGMMLLGAQNVATNGAGNVSFTVDVAATLPPGSPITSTATNPQGSTSEFSPCVASTGLADLSITKSGLPNPVTSGTNLTYTLTVSNNGPNDATSVVVTDNLPTGLSFVSCMSTAGGVCSGSGNNRTISFSSLAASASATITLVAQVSCALTNGSMVSNTASVNSPLLDSNVLNNSSTVSNGVSNPPASIDPTSRAFPADGGLGDVMVTQASPCNWTAVSNVPWIQVTQGSTGSGNGFVSYLVAENDTGSARNGTMTIAGQTFTVQQTDVFCTFSLLPLSNTFAAIGGEGDVTVAAGPLCHWKAVPNVDWISITNGETGIGFGVFSYTVDQNLDPDPRTGTVTVAGAVFTINQAAGCANSISPLSRAIVAGGDMATVNVVAGAGCMWTSSTTAPWIEITTGTGSGNGTVTYSVLPNSSERARAGIVVAAGWMHAVVQQGTGQGKCDIAIKPKTRSFGSLGGSDTISIAASVACAWSATPSDNWITITSASNGIGTGIVTYSVSTNSSGTSRVGTINISGKIFTVKQKGN